MLSFDIDIFNVHVCMAWLAAIVRVRYSDVVASVKGLVEDSHRFVGSAPASQP